MRFLGRLARIWLGLAFVVTIVYSAVYHQAHVAIEMPPWIEHVTMPGYMIFLSFFFGGVLTVSIFFWLDGLRKSLEIRRLNKRLRELAPVDRETADSLTSGTREPML